MSRPRMEIPEDKRQRLIRAIQVSGLSVSEAARAVGLPRNRAHELYNQWKALNGQSG